MKSRFNYLFRYLLVFILLFCVCFVPLRTSADSGWDSSYDSSSSWDSGSSWSSSGSDYGSSSSSSSGDIDPVTFLIFLMFVIAVYVVIIHLTSKSSNLKNNSFSGNVHTINNYCDIDNLSDILREFGINDVGEFKNNLYNTFKEIQIAWMNFDYDKLREYTTDEMFNMYKSQLEALKLKNQQNIMSDFNLGSVKIIRVDSDSNPININVFMNVEFYDYVIDSNSGKVVRGTKKKKINIDYMMSFVGSSDEIHNCPNCGAELGDTSSQVCSYCRSTIVKTTNKFILSKKTNIGQR